MEESDRSTEGIDFEGLRDQIARRKLLLSAVAISGGSVLITQSNSTQKEETNHLAKAETQLVEAAGLINNADLVNPRENSILHDEISRAVESVTNILDQISSDGPQAEQRVSGLNTAIEYYNTLKRTFNVGTTLLTQVADSELDVLNHKRTLEYDPITEFDLDTLEESITRLTQVEKGSEAITSKGRKLVPDQQRVIDSLRAQRDVFDQHLTAQQTYLDTATAIEAGIRAHEQSQFDTARSKLTEVRESLSTGIPETELSYRLSNVGLSLDQYATVLSLRREGVSKLISICEESVPEQQSRAVANTALDQFFKARRVVTN